MMEISISTKLNTAKEDISAVVDSKISSSIKSVNDLVSTQIKVINRNLEDVISVQKTYVAEKDLLRDRIDDITRELTGLHQEQRKLEAF